jgi:hypothetical protein
MGASVRAVAIALDLFPRHRDVLGIAAPQSPPLSMLKLGRRRVAVGRVAAEFIRPIGHVPRRIVGARFCGVLTKMVEGEMAAKIREGCVIA